MRKFPIIVKIMFINCAIMIVINIVNLFYEFPIVPILIGIDVLQICLCLVVLKKALNNGK